MSTNQNSGIDHMYMQNKESGTVHYTVQQSLNFMTNLGQQNLIPQNEAVRLPSANCHFVHQFKILGDLNQNFALNEDFVIVHYFPASNNFSPSLINRGTKKVSFAPTNRLERNK